mmetsp:Transcript_19484/g.31903  ORF Transcript_19484/g.31903 Transcript_19484/m.31903 type:complete len:199 (-) Transcript_19484:70-666(-)
MEVDVSYVRQRSDSLLESISESEGSEECSDDNDSSGSVSPVRDPVTDVSSILTRLHELDGVEQIETQALEAKWKSASASCGGDYERVFKCLCEYKRYKKMLKSRFEKQRADLRFRLRNTSPLLQPSLMSLKRRLSSLANQRDSMLADADDSFSLEAIQEINQRIQVTKEDYYALEQQCDAVFEELGSGSGSHSEAEYL